VGEKVGAVDGVEVGRGVGLKSSCVGDKVGSVLGGEDGTVVGAFVGLP